MNDDRQHFGLCLRNREPGWISLSRESGTWRGIGINSSLEGHIEPMQRKIGLNPMSNFTFSGARRAQQIMDEPLVDQPSPEALKAMLPGYSLTILAPINHPEYSGLWANIWRDPRGGLSTRKDSRFVAAILLDQIDKWFAFFGPKKIETGRAGAVELWVRREWSASALLPDEFPAAKSHPQAFLDAKAAHMARQAKRKSKRVPTAGAAA